MARSKLTVVVREDQRTFLDNHPEINVSGLLQRAVDHEMQRDGIVVSRSA